MFLETCDLREYNPFLLNIKKPQYFKVNFYLKFHFILKKKTALGLLVYSECVITSITY